MKKLSIILSLLVLPAVVSAQGLHKEIDVERSVTPAKRQAERIGVLPTVSLPALKPTSLQFSDKVYTSQVTPAIRVLNPIAWNARPYGASSRGYLDLAVGAPLAQGGVSAGYRVLASDTTSLHVWGQYNGDVYKRASSTWHDHTATLGADFMHRLTPGLRLGADVYYTYGFHDMPGLWGRFAQGASEVAARISADGEAGPLSYHGAVAYDHFGFCSPHWSDAALKAMQEDTSDAVADVNGTSENLYRITAGASLQMAEHSWIGLDVDARLLYTANHALPLIPYFEESDRLLFGHTTRGLAALRPSYSFRGESASATIGALIDIAGHDGTTFKVAPDVTLAWHAMQYLAAEVKIHGGSTLNSLSDLYQISPYLNPTLAYKRSHAPVIVDARLAFGPFLGGTVEIFGGYARANDWLMPVAAAYETGGLAFESQKVSGYRYGVRLGYDNGGALTFSASWQHSPGELKKAWLDCRDRARNVVNATLSVRPLSPLKIDVDYELRSGRCIYGYYPDPSELLGLTYYEFERQGLGAISNLSAGATYTVSRPLSVFARAQNILSRRALLLGGRPVQGFNLLVGASLKF